MTPTGRIAGRKTGWLINCALFMAFMAGGPASAQNLAPAHQQYRDAFPEGVRGFVSMDWREKHKTLGGLVGQGKAALPMLLFGLQTSQKLDAAHQGIPVQRREVGRHCAIALGEIGDREAVPALIQALQHPDRDTRREVVMALGTIGDRRAIAPLVALWANPTEDRTNKRQAAFALVGFGKEAVPVLASANIQEKRDCLATAALLRIALEDEPAVLACARENAESAGVKQCAEALRELRRRQNNQNPVAIEEIERKAKELEGRLQLRSALDLWESVLDTGLYSPQEDERAREAMLRIKKTAGRELFKEPVATWKNKVLILAKYEGDLPDAGPNKPRHVGYALSEKEIAIIRERFRLVEKAVNAGSCGALRMENDITVVDEPWGVFRPTIRNGPGNKGRYQITRKDLDATFRYQERYLARGFDCVFFVMRGDLKTFELDGGAAGPHSVLNAQRERFDDLGILPQCHEWLHVLQFAVWTRGGFDWMQCIPLHDQLREMQLCRAWRTGQFPGQEDVFVEVMQKYMTTRMWESIARRGQVTVADVEMEDAEIPPTPHAGAQEEKQTLAEPIRKGLRVFSCGHSFMPGVQNGLRIAAMAGDIRGHVNVGASGLGGSRFVRHWDIPDEENKAKKALSEGKVDVLTLMPIYLPDPGIENFALYGLQFNPDIRFLVQEFWLPYDYYATPQDRTPSGVPRGRKVDHDSFTAEDLQKAHEPYFKEMDEHIRSLNEKIGKQAVFVVPVGQAVIMLREKIIAGEAPGLTTQAELFRDHLGHPQPVITWLQVYCHYAVMYRRNPLGLSVPPPMRDREELVHLLQEIAWRAATRHPLSGLKAPER